MKHLEYNKVAKDYDAFYHSKKVFLEEDEKLSAFLQNGIKGRVLDVGSGTGWLMDNLNIDPQWYLGVDPSENMVKVSKEKHPHHEVLVGGIEDIAIPEANFDTILAIYGVLTYMDLNEVEHLGKLAMAKESRIFLMENIDGYGSQVIEAAKIKPVKGNNIETIQKAVILGQYVNWVQVFQWSKYIIFTNFPNYEDLLTK